MEMLAKETARLFVFTDLDDTLFKSKRDPHCDLSITATVDSNGKAYAYSSVQQQKLLEIMSNAGAIIIPVTGRRTASFLNCKLPVIINSQYAIVSHGAVILDSSYSLLAEWHAFLQQQFNLTQWEARLIALCEHLQGHFALRDDVRVRLIVDQGISAYVCIKIAKNNYNEDKSSQVERRLKRLLQQGMLLHGNGRNFAILPPYAQKQVAVNFLKEKMAINQRDTVFGIGDSNSDLPFMSDSDFLIVPRDAQILNKDREQ